MLPLAALGFIKSLDIKTWAIIGLSVVIASMYAVISFKNHRIDGLNNDVKAKELVIEQYKQNVVVLKDSISKQNDAIVDMASKNAVYEEMLAKAGVKAKKLNDQANVIIKYIEKEPVPTNCDGAMKHLEKFTHDYAQEWNTAK